jgi:protein-tyrosine phosphatase
MIDLHAHILPALDDGPPTTEAAVAMARAASEAGTYAMATTSHVEYSFSLAAEQLVGAREALSATLAEEGIALELLAGGEIGANRLPDLDDDELRALALGGGPYVLLECPLAPVDAGMEGLVDDLHGRGFRVLLAHPERSPSFQRDPGLLGALVEQGALGQITAGSLTGEFGTVPRRRAEEMLEDGLVHVLASDAHDAVHRAPVLDVEDVVGPAQHEWMTTAVPEAIVTGQPLPPRPRERGRVRSWSER